MKRLLIAFSLALSVLFAAPANAQVVEPLRPYDPAVVRVAGRAEVYLPPDQARVRLSFYAPGRTAGEATNAVSERTRALDAAVRAIDAQNVVVERTDVSVTPVMREGGDRRPDRINGYEASAGVTILVRDLARLSQTVEVAVNAQPDTFNDVEFSIRDTARARRAAREAAITDAVDKARVYSEGAGHRLGRLLLVEEGANNMIAQSGNRAVFAARPQQAYDQAAVTAPTIAAEPLLYTAEVSVVFEVGAAMPAR
ncbi:MAG: SIMPL domain-containing protein [Hyphomonadaceae bacterium]|nr:SIMPL domain-containing protein [Hyphomonadaceae bacterium]